MPFSRKESRISGKTSGFRDNENKIVTGFPIVLHTTLKTQPPKVDFTNDILDTTTLPRFEDVPFRLLDRRYWKVTLLSIFTTFSIIGVLAVLAILYVDDVDPVTPWMISGIVAAFVLTLLLSRVGFLKKGYAFREHDVLYRHGIIATKTIVIPYNRVQHVALHEGLFSRMFGLAEVAVFTAGGNSGDIDIPGIAKAEAEDIKQLLMGKILKTL